MGFPSANGPGRGGVPQSPVVMLKELKSDIEVDDFSCVHDCPFLVSLEPQIKLVRMLPARSVVLLGGTSRAGHRLARDEALWEV